MLEDSVEEVLEQNQLRARRSVASAVAADGVKGRQDRAQKSPSGWAESKPERVRSTDSFESASDGGDVSQSAAFRPALPKLQQHFSGRADDMAKVSRPDFLPPEVNAEGSRPSFLPPPEPEEEEQHEERIIDSGGPDSADELLTWLQMASGSRPDHVARIVAWLLQLLHFYGIEDLQEETACTMGRLPDSTLIRVFAEAAGSRESSQELGMEAHISCLAAMAEPHLDKISYQQVALCLAAFVTTTDASTCELLIDSGPSWALKAMERHRDDAVVRFWAASLLSALTVHCNAWSVVLPCRDEAVRLLLLVGEAAVKKPAWGPTPRMSLEATCRALTRLWLDTAEQQLCDRALNFVTRMMDMPSAGVPWAHSCLLLLGRLGLTSSGHSRSASFPAACSRLATLLGRSQDADEVTAALEAAESLLSQAFSVQHSMDASAAEMDSVAQVLASAIGTLRRLSDVFRVESAGAGLVLAAAEASPALLELVRSKSGLDWLQSVVAAWMLPEHILARAQAVLQQSD